MIFGAAGGVDASGGTSPLSIVISPLAVVMRTVALRRPQCR